MKIRIAIVLFFVGTVFSLNAQNSELIVGKWAFEDAAPKEKAEMDSLSLRMLNLFLADLSIYFRKNGSYKFVMMGKTDEGSWNWVDDSKNIKLNSNNGDGMEVEVLELSKSRLLLKMAKGSFVMKNVKPELDDLFNTELVIIEGLSATKAQVSKKWYFQSRYSKNDTTQSEVVNELMKGSYLELEENGSYQAEIIGVKDKAKWKFGPDNTTIIVMSEGIEKKWTIKSVSETNLVLVRGNGEVWVFSTEQ